MANAPKVNLGTLNKARVHVVVANNNTLNVDPQFMGKDMVSMSPQGNAAELIDMAAARVTSPNLYLPVQITINVAKTTGTFANWRSQWENNSIIGDVRLMSDTSALPDFTINNCAIVGIGDLPFNGTTAEAQITIEGTYYINNSMWNL